MARCIFWFLDNDNYVNLEAEEMHEDQGYIKAYNHNELVGMFKSEFIKSAYLTEENKKER